MTMRVGVIGAGWVADARHIPSLKLDKRVEVAAIYDRTPERAAGAAAKFKVPFATGDLGEFFAQELDAISICTSPWSHAELAVEAVSHGCHVLVEKPMAMNLGEAQQMAAAAEAADRVLCVSHNFLFSRAVQRADRALAGATEIRYANGLQLSSDLRRLPSWYEDLPGGLLFDEIPHLLYMLQHYLGELQLDGVRVSRRSERGHPIVAEVHVTGEKGPGQASVVSGAPLSEWHVSVVADTGVVDLDLFRDIAVRLRPDGSHGALDILKTSSRALLEHGRGFASSGARMTARRLFWGHDVLVSRFIDACLGIAPSPVGIEQAVGLVALTDDVLAALSSA